MNTMANKHLIALFGDTGMVGQELEKALDKHPHLEVSFRQNSSRSEGKLEDCDGAFLATKDEESMALAPKLLALGLRVVDMSGAFRLGQATFEKWYGIEHRCPELLKQSVYGMPALFSEQIKTANLVGNPGCYPTAVILALKPIISLIDSEVSVVATSGNSGARREVEASSNEIAYSYGRKHRHVPEMEQYSGARVEFCPIVLRSVYRGINANLSVKLNTKLALLPSQEAQSVLEKTIESTYKMDDQVYIVRDNLDKQWGTADVVNTHQLLIKIRVDEGKAYINCLIDNLSKGAASQGVENMNLMLGLPRMDALLKIN